MVWDAGGARCLSVGCPLQVWGRKATQEAQGVTILDRRGREGCDWPPGLPCPPSVSEVAWPHPEGDSPPAPPPSTHGVTVPASFVTAGHGRALSPAVRVGPGAAGAGGSRRGQARAHPPREAGGGHLDRGRWPALGPAPWWARCRGDRAAAFLPPAPCGSSLGLGRQCPGPRDSRRLQGRRVSAAAVGLRPDRQAARSTGSGR